MRRRAATGYGAGCLQQADEDIGVAHKGIVHATRAAEAFVAAGAVVATMGGDRELARGVTPE